MAEHIEREALMRRIKEIHCAECDSYHGVRCRACWVDDTLDYIESEPAADVEPVQEWISVKDRLPECEGSYIVYTERGSIYSNHFYTEKRFASGYVREAQWSKRGTVKVTHWMPLPEPPKGE